MRLGGSPRSTLGVGALSGPPLPAARATKAAPKANHSRVALLQTLGLAPSPSAKTNAPSSEAKLAQKIAALETEQVVALIDAGERLLFEHPKNKRLDAKIGEHLRVPVEQIHPGQTQLSFDHVRVKMLEILARAQNDEALLDKGDLIGLLGPGERSLVLLDGHHKLAALLALRAIFEPQAALQLTGKNKVTGQSELAKRILEFSRAPKVEITHDLRPLKGAAFWKSLASGVTDAAVYLTKRDGTQATRAPARFSALSDNPYRELASAASVKAIRTGDKRGDFELRGEDYPVWIKDPVAPDFIEFRIGRIFEEALAEHGLSFDPKKPVSKKVRAVLAEALSKAAQDPNHPEYAFLKDLVIIGHPVSIDALRPLIKVGRKRGRVRWKD